MILSDVPRPPPSAPPSPPTSSPGVDLEDVLLRLDALREDMTTLEATMIAAHDAIVPSMRASARNLAHYVALRRHDLRNLQTDLARLGLSSLGRTEAHVLANVDAVRRVVTRLLDRPYREPTDAEHPVGYGEGRARLDLHTAALLGPSPAGRRVHVMVTLPSEAATDPRLVRDLVESGMSVARINCAHDDALAWERMSEHVRTAAVATGRPCRILMDLAGPSFGPAPSRQGRARCTGTPRATRGAR